LQLLMTHRDEDLDRVLHGTLFGEAVVNAEVAALLADERGFYIAVNEQACVLTGYTRDELTAFRAGELSANEESRRIYEEMLGADRLRGRKQVKCRDGSVVDCCYWGIRTKVARLSYVLLLLWQSSSASGSAMNV
jgi:PAS domain S-box-containing protein